MNYVTRKETISNEEFNKIVEEILPRPVLEVFDIFMKDVLERYNYITHFYKGRIDAEIVISKEIYNSIDLNNYKPFKKRELFLIMNLMINKWYNLND
jgi:hypothetical protein